MYVKHIGICPVPDFFGYTSYVMTGRVTDRIVPLKPVAVYIPAVIINVESGSYECKLFADTADITRVNIHLKLRKPGIQPGDFLNKLKQKKVLYRKIAYIDTNQEYDIFKDELYKSFYGDLSLTKAIESRVDLFFKDKERYSHQCELRCIVPNVLLRKKEHSKKIHLKNLSSIDALNSEKRNATGADFINNIKIASMSGTVTMEILY